MELICPKCHGPMRSYERNGITIDQCRECRGVFLDRGELERLIDAEAAFSAPAAAPPDPRPATPAYGSPSGYREDRDPDSRYRESRYDDRYEGAYDRKKRKRSFLEDLFD
jgi:Zn-finger nucleic acid-binding protein